MPSGGSNRRSIHFASSVPPHSSHHHGISRLSLTSSSMFLSQLIWGICSLTLLRRTCPFPVVLQVANVFQCGMSCMRSLLEAYEGHVSNRDILSASADFVPLLVEKTGDNSSRMQALATEGLLYLCATPGMDPVIAPHVCKPTKNQSAWKVVLARLNLMQQLCEQFGIGTKDSARGLPLDGVMNYVAAALGSPNGDVRSAAVKCTVDVYQHAGNAVRQYFPKEMNKALRDQLEQALEDAADGVPATKRATSAKTRKPQAGTTPSPPPPPKNAAEPPPPPPAPPAATQAQGEAEPDGADAEEDPAVYERELSEREAELGPDHPDVAESLSNLAILYNQQGQYDKAQPLYERALAIWERTQGPKSSDVAHTLTDLAVLHLEQGNDHVGRPLLERALEIQRENLGEDHPDVVAIMEVLQSDD